MPELKKEQKNAIFHDDGNILVSASAGSGKTFVMIQRLIRLISEKKADVSEILAVTFTDSAAADMKDKLKKAIVEKVQQGEKSLAKVIPEVDTADISTMHAFCGRLIRKYFFVVGLSPDFVIADETRSALIKKESIDKTFKALYAQRERWFLDLVDKFAQNRSDSGLKELVLNLFDFFSAEADPRASALNTLENYREENFERILSQIKGYLDLKLSRLMISAENAKQGAIRYSLSVGENFCNELIEDIKTLQNCNLYEIKKMEGYNRRFAFGSKLPPDATQYKDLASGIRDSLKKLIAEVCKNLTDKENDKLVLARVREDSENLCKVLFAFSENYKKAKREENVLDFSDLEHFALELLKDPEVSKAVKEKYKYVFIDEYQDVNGVQEELMSLITKDNLFMVGDIKQSIYGFRGCRAEFFSDKMEQMPKMGQKTLQLNYNFRSADAVIEMVNQIFVYSMTKDRFGMDYTKCKLVSGGLFGTEHLGRAQIHTLIREKKPRGTGEKPRIYDLLEEMDNSIDDQDVDLSSLVAEIINSELHKKFFDTKLGEERNVTFGDIAILTRNKENKYVTSLVNGLIRHGVPVVSEISQDICDFPEVQVLINALKLINGSCGDIPLASTLKSVIGKFTDEELAEIVLFYRDNRQDKRTPVRFYDAYAFYLENAKTSLSERLKKFDEDFSNIRVIADFIGAHDVLEKLVEDSCMQASLFAERFGDVKVKRIRKFISESISGDKKLTIAEFLALVEDNKKAFGLREIAEEDTVKIMTMHASKGLEFPVVIVCGLERKMPVEDGKDVCITDRDLGFAIKYFNPDKRTTNETLIRYLIKQKAKEQDLKEELRLLYVATTRPTYSLHLTLLGEPKKNPEVFVDANCFEECLPPNLPITKWKEEQFALVQTQKNIRDVAFSTPEKQACDRIMANFEYSYPYEQDVNLPLKSTATKEIKAEQSSTLTHYAFDDELSDTERGVIAHKIMENVDFTCKVDLKEQTLAMVENGVLTSEQIAKINLDKMQKVFDSKVFDGLKDKKLYREKSFIAQVDASFINDSKSLEKVVVQGQIDLLAVSQEGAEIIDYKYSTLIPESLEIKYQKQLKLYSQALQVSTGLKVNNLSIVNLLTGDVVDIK